MALSKEQEDLYRKTMEEAKSEMKGIDAEMEKEIQKLRGKLAEIQESKKYIKQIYEATAKLLKIEVEVEEEKESKHSKTSLLRDFHKK